MYHLSMKIVSRGKGKSSVAAAAYRAGETIKNEYDGKLHDYSRKKGVVFTNILLPDNAPDEYKDRSLLWNAVEKVEKACNSQLAREIEISIPKELHFSEYFSLVHEYVRENFTKHGMCADIAIHDTENGNPHCHILLTMRPFTEDKTWRDKQKKVYILDQQGNKIYDPVKRQYKCNKIQTTDWNERHKAEEWRASWADICNRHFERIYSPKRLDHRSYKRQGIDQIPTIHLGAAAHQMEQRGIRTERGDINRAIQISNRKLRQIEERLNELHGWLEEERSSPEPQPVYHDNEAAAIQNPQPPKRTFADVIREIISNKDWHFANSQMASEIVAFLKDNKIADYEGIEKHLRRLMSKQRDLTHKLKPIRERIEKLDIHMEAYEEYKKLKTEFQKYEQDYKAQSPWKKKSFEKNHSHIVNDYEISKTYIDSVRNDKGKIPTGAWKKEHAELLAEKQRLTGEYNALKNKVDQVDKIRKYVYDFLREEQQRPELQLVKNQPVKSEPEKIQPPRMQPKKSRSWERG